MTDDGVLARGSLRSRGASLVSALTLRQVSAVLSFDHARGLWLSRQVHVFQALPRLSPEAAKAMAQVAHFIDTSRRANGFDAIAGKAG
jgi:hypothetical protein